MGGALLDRGQRRSVYGSKRKEAADKLAKALVTVDEPPTPPVPPNITVRVFFARYADAVRDTMKRRSFETYRDIARLHLLPAFRGHEARAPESGARATILLSQTRRWSGGLCPQARGHSEDRVPW
jgi:hypothetical protein